MPLYSTTLLEMIFIMYIYHLGNSIASRHTDVILIGWDSVYITTVTDNCNDFCIRLMRGLVG